MALGNKILQELAEKPWFELMERIVLYVSGVSVTSILTLFDADPTEIREHATSIDKARTALLEEQASATKEVGTVDTYWDGLASTEFVNYMGKVNTYMGNVAAACERTTVAGNKVADELEKAINTIHTLLVNLGERIAAWIAGIVTVILAEIPGAIIAAVTLTINEIVSLGHRVFATNTLLNELNDAVPGATTVTPVPFELPSDSGYDSPSDLTQGAWKPA